MSLIFHIALGALLMVTFYQDWKYRAIVWFIFPGMAIAALLIFLLPGGDWRIPGSNLIFVLLVVALLFLWVSARERKLTNIFERHFGLGDLLFFIAIVPLFGHQNFVLFFISGMMFSGLIHLVVSYKMNRTSIPLAGYLALYVLLLKGVSLVFNTDLFHMYFFV